MKRLVYAPKVWIFIRASNITDEKTGEEGKIFDVSSDIVRGSVTQNLGDLSSAQFELRNRYHKWLRYRSSGSNDLAENDYRQIFLPMDLVTIWMQRVSGRPVQVFTGYLDSVPYYQAYPGTAIFEASCTLKKLAYNWFDPGLTVFQNWMQANGWAYDPGTGQVIAKTDTGGNGLITNSASFGDILGRFLIDVAGWEANDIVIGELPVRIGEVAADIRSELKELTNITRKELAAFYSQILGVNGVTGISSTIQNQSDIENTPLDSHERRRDLPIAPLETVDIIKDQAGVRGLPPWILIFAAYATTGFNESFNYSKNDRDNWGYGLYGMRPNSGLSTIGRGESATTDRFDGVLISQIVSSPEVASKVMTDALVRVQPSIADTASAAWSGDPEAALRWINTALGYEVSSTSTDFGAVKRRADQLAGTTKATPRDGHDGRTGDQAKTDGSSPSVTVDIKNTPITDEKVTSRLSVSEKKVASSFYKNADPEMGYVVIGVKQFAEGLQLSQHADLNPNQVFFTSNTPERLQRLFDAMRENTLYFGVELFLDGEHTRLNNGVESGLGLESKLNKEGILITANILNLRKLGVAATDLAAGAGDQDPQGGITFPQLAAFSANAAFAANFAFDADIITANLLVGAKALMNDTSCLDAVKQMTQACLRTFRSLPDGRFMAFYPDYFGSTRPPYWQIYDIEITDFGIQLNDAALATHVYVIGDTMFQNEAGSIFNQVHSEGVATITQLRMLDSFISPLVDWGIDDPIKLKREQAFRFLSHYGARPHREDMPLIRNREFEFLMAWQKFMWLWAQQFATNASFTFQPEVMAGGLIAFPDHDIQMFCESVTHSFDYEGGFSTDAVLTAPSLLGNKVQARHGKPGFALGGGINTVGVSG